jgi:hypothetical protein
MERVASGKEKISATSGLPDAWRQDLRKLISMTAMKVMVVRTNKPEAN